jgi:hypothetical protein
MTELQLLEDRFKDLILNTCNKIGCDKCGYKYDGGCSSTILQDKIMELEYPEILVGDT